ncbi:hypothetical protein [Paraliomyxa miuraensis]|uniref:hypothetical protein n=1 Tax=Paraliomyxa miuraensis TaxID=376150 RepID=UPI002258F963|nr:hypothetical protein [Paraliomyxa miuraensis]MCX4248079.1 hypothetical protein [Paraliomyxa miuraensis]
MRWPRRGILIRLAIYLPVISFLAWRAAGGCQGDDAAQAPAPAPDPMKQHRRVITMPDGSQQEIVELSREEAEQILGRPIPDPAKAEAEATEAKAPNAEAEASAAVEPTTADAAAPATASPAD